MPILLLLLGFFFPRIIIIILYLTNDWWESAFSNILILLLGFLFMPLTTLWYGISEFYFSDQVQLIGLVVAVLADLGLIGRGLRK